MPLVRAAVSGQSAQRGGIAVLAGSLWFFPALAQDDAADLLFNCRLAGVKRVYLVDMTRRMLIDQGNAYPAQVGDDAIDAERLQDWDAHTRMRHRVHIGRRDGALVYQVDELDTSGTVRSRVVSESGTCSREKIHPRHLR